jgi:hypothetical protein
MLLTALTLKFHTGIAMKFVLILGIFLFAGKSFSAPLYISDLDYGAIKIETDILINGQSRKMMVDTGANESIVSLDEQSKYYAAIVDSHSSTPNLLVGI